MINTLTTNELDKGIAQEFFKMNLVEICDFEPFCGDSLDEREERKLFNQVKVYSKSIYPPNKLPKAPWTDVEDDSLEGTSLYRALRSNLEKMRDNEASSNDENWGLRELQYD